MTALLLLPVGPLCWALSTIALPDHAARIAAAVAIVATLVAATTLAGQVLMRGVLRLELGGWAPPLGIALEADGLSAVLVVMTVLVVPAVVAAAGALGAGVLAASAVSQLGWATLIVEREAAP